MGKSITPTEILGATLIMAETTPETFSTVSKPDVEKFNMRSKRPNNRFVGASSADLTETKIVIGIESIPTKWDDLTINSTFSKSKNGLPLCVKVSVSAFVEIFTNRRESRIGGGEVFKVVQK